MCLTISKFSVFKNNLCVNLDSCKLLKIICYLFYEVLVLMEILFKNYLSLCRGRVPGTPTKTVHLWQTCFAKG